MKHIIDVDWKTGKLENWNTLEISGTETFKRIEKYKCIQYTQIYKYFFFSIYLNLHIYT